MNANTFRSAATNFVASTQLESRHPNRSIDWRFKNPPSLPRALPRQAAPFSCRGAALTRAGSYERSLQTSAGDINLKIPKLRRQTFETPTIERYRRRESSVEEALIEMYLAGISVRRVEDITEALWGTRVSPSTVSNLNKKIYAKIEAWRNRHIEGEHPYLYLDEIVMKRTWAGEVRNVSLLVASAVNSEGFREILGICEGAKEDKSGWSAFLRHLVDRGLNGVQLIISDACRGLL